MLGAFLLGLTSFGLGYLVASIVHDDTSIDLPARDKAKFDEGFHAAMSVVRQRNSIRGKKAAANRLDRQTPRD